jgi:hypothetical protein
MASGFGMFRSLFAPVRQPNRLMGKQSGIGAAMASCRAYQPTSLHEDKDR